MRGDRFLWVLLIFLFVGVVILVANHDQGEVMGLDLGQFGQLIVLLSLTAVIGAGAWRMFHGRMAAGLKAALFWMVIVLGLAVVYAYRDPLRQVADRVISEAIPGYAVNSEGGTVEIARAANGSFAVGATINGAGITLMLDTGASAVVLTQDHARAAGLTVDTLRYDVPVDTANGRTRAASVVLDRVTVGSITERNVRALVSAPGALRSSLLGMSFLSRLDGFEIRGDRLILRGPAR
ncbi:TIGR02281 family clan AA aspartic protease [Aquabacter sp. CN5-332]|uniref:TIGR02281 family clan AA aspartic protease n=1 Tax=Aquabacter sp. CN5-332 TaxID=3156608 RepID=UPI0032B50389